MAISIHFVRAPYAAWGNQLAMLFFYNGLNRIYSVSRSGRKSEDGKVANVRLDRVMK